MNIYLKIKIKSLAEEARIIRKQESAIDGKHFSSKRARLRIVPS